MAVMYSTHRTLVFGVYGAISVSEGDDDLPTPVRPSPMDRGAVGPSVIPISRNVLRAASTRTDCHTLHVWNHAHSRMSVTVGKEAPPSGVL